MGPYDGTKKRGVLRSGVFWDKNISAHVSFNVICLFLIDSYGLWSNPTWFSRPTEVQLLKFPPIKKSQLQSSLEMYFYT